MARSYEDAVKSLNTLQSNFTVVDAIRKSGRKMNEQAIPEMIEWCRKIGYKPSAFKAFRPIHIAGTKGKGSTAAFTSSILAQFVNCEQQPHALQFSKVGLYTSPHLTSVRERIQINGVPLDEATFARYFFEVWDRLEFEAKNAGQDPDAPGAKPVYFRYLTLMAFHTYISEEVEVAIIECGIGGAYDSTNVIDSPSVTGITTLGIDHVGILGSKIEEIAWHKAGIMKKEVDCYTPIDQPAEARNVLEMIAKDKECFLEFTETYPGIQQGDFRLGLQGDFQKINASLAVKMASKWLRLHGYYDNEVFWGKVRRGLQSVRWPGRCETRHGLGIKWCIDGAHTLESIKVAGDWFASQLTTNSSNSVPTPTGSSPPTPRFLLFNQQGSRDASSLATELWRNLSTALEDAHPFTHVIFCTNTTFEESGYKPDLVSVNTNDSDVQSLKVQQQLAETWAELDSKAHVEVVRTIEGAICMIQGFADAYQRNNPVGATRREVTTLVTGSLHLVGGFLAVLEKLAGPPPAAPDPDPIIAAPANKPAPVATG